MGDENTTRLKVPKGEVLIIESETVDAARAKELLDASGCVAALCCRPGDRALVGRIRPDGTIDGWSITDSHGFRPLMVGGIAVEVNDAEQVLRIEGVRYTFDFFAALGTSGVAVGTTLRVDRRDPDGTVWLTRVECAPRAEE